MYDNTRPSATYLFEIEIWAMMCVFHIIFLCDINWL